MTRGGILRFKYHQSVVLLSDHYNPGAGDMKANTGKVTNLHDIPDQRQRSGFSQQIAQSKNHTPCKGLGRAPVYFLMASASPCMMPFIPLIDGGYRPVCPVPTSISQ